MSIITLAILGLAGLVIFAVVLYGFIFIMKKKQISAARQRHDEAARSAVQSTVEDRGFVPHG